MIKIDIKPLSINKAYTGRRFKTNELRSYSRMILLSLKPMKIPDGKLELILEFGFSNRGADWDNCIKVFQDLLQKKYKFNDNRVYKGSAEKIIVPKGQEYIKFEIKSY